MKTKWVKINSGGDKKSIFYGRGYALLPNLRVEFKYLNGDVYRYEAETFISLQKQGKLFDDIPIVGNDYLSVGNAVIKIKTNETVEYFFIEYETPLLTDAVSFNADKSVNSLADTINSVDVIADVARTINAGGHTSFSFTLPSELNVLMGITEIVFNTHDYSTYNYMGIAIESIVNDGTNIKVFVTNVSAESVLIKEPKIHIIYV